MNGWAVRIIWLISLITFFSTSALTQSPPEKDPQAVALARGSLEAMGEPQARVAYQNSVATGTVTIYGQESSVAYPVTLKSRGTHQFRYDIRKPNGTDSYVLNHAVACVTQNGRTTRGIGQNAVVRRIDHIPVLSLLSEHAHPEVKVQYAGSESLAGGPADAIALSFSPPGLRDGPRATQQIFWIDRTTGFAAKVRFRQYAENGTENPFVTEMFFSDYRNVNGLLIPFRRVTYIEQQLANELALTSVVLNAGISPEDFALSCEVNDAQQ